MFLPVVCGSNNCDYANECMAGLSGFAPEECSLATVSLTKQGLEGVESIAPTEVEVEENEDGCPVPSGEGACGE